MTGLTPGPTARLPCRTRRRSLRRTPATLLERGPDEEYPPHQPLARDAATEHSTGPRGETRHQGSRRPSETGFQLSPLTPPCLGALTFCRQTTTNSWNHPPTMSTGAVPQLLAPRVVATAQQPGTTAAAPPEGGSYGGVSRNVAVFPRGRVRPCSSLNSGRRWILRGGERPPGLRSGLGHAPRGVPARPVFAPGPRQGTPAVARGGHPFRTPPQPAGVTDLRDHRPRPPVVPFLRRPGFTTPSPRASSPRGRRRRGGEERINVSITHKSGTGGLRSADRNDKATLQRTRPRSASQSYAEDLSPRTRKWQSAS